MKTEKPDLGKLQVPKPAHPVNRREPLPWCSPKSREDDPGAPARVQAILDSPSYRRADADLDFLALDETRGVRLQIDYLKPELLFEQHQIHDTIVVFGSTRICEPAAARRKLKILQDQLASDAGNKSLARRAAIAERILANSKYYEIAREFARLASAAHPTSHQSQALVTGGGPGIMEATNRGAFDVGAKSIGLNISLPHEQYPNPYITPGLCFSFHYFAVRKLHFLMRARALVAFPGGYGTFDELFEVLTLVQTRKIKPMPIILVGEAYWRRAINLDFLVDEGVIDPEDRELFWFAETAEEIWNGILHWHDITGQPIDRA
ncbi:MAG TPA: TIGR00730 family Rossman fold protein [Stellaceae bacterium]|nr:TIGR00730 family Rossman fold protein [Stellaceae bacterium]